jgi:hypothetical protein
VEFVDDIIKVEIITAGDRKTERFFKRFKEHLKQLLNQLDILITVQNIRTLWLRNSGKFGDVTALEAFNSP